MTSPPFCWVTLHPSFGASRRPASGDRGALDIFRDEPNRRAAPGLRGLLG